MRILIAEDDMTAGIFMKKILSTYGDCDLAVNGRSALEYYKAALESGDPYEVVCLDIMMPYINGHAVLKEIRKIEDENGMLNATKVIMTTALKDSEVVREAFIEQADAYLIKPIEKDKIEETFKELELIEVE